MTDCTFCRIERGELPADFRYQDDDVIAFKDIAPRAAFHVLVLPRKHIALIAQTDGERSLGSWCGSRRSSRRARAFGEREFRV